MHLNYYFLRRLSKILSEKLIQFEAAEIFSQNKDELILSFLNGKEEFHIKAVLSTQFTALAFPTEFARARKNSVDLFPVLIDLKVESVYQFNNERSFSIDFEKGYRLLFKMHGKRANVILYHEDNQLALFNSQMKFDLGLSLTSLDRNFIQNKSQYLKNGLSIFPTFDQNIKQYLHKLGYQEGNENNWDLIQKVVSDMDKNITIFQEEKEKAPQLTLLEVSNQNFDILKVTDNPIEATNEFYYQYTKKYFLQEEKNNVVRLLNKKLKKTLNYISKTSKKLEDIEQKARHQEIADILMANLHNVPKNSSETTLFDFYRNEDLLIKLKKDLSPQKNAEYLYRKAKNQKLEVEKLYENLFNKENLTEEIELQIKEVLKIDSLKLLRKYVKEHNILKESNENNESEPFIKVLIGQWIIYVGRNARNNDELTQKHAHKNDLWLHAKDVSGSHVLIKQIPGRTYSTDVIEKAAQLAAFYSKRKNDTVCPVLYTPRKFVRKPKGMLPGQVIVDREEVVLVEPMSIESILKENK